MQGVVCEIFSVSGVDFSPIFEGFFFSNSAVKKVCIDLLNCR